jgi:hypothetical protein
MVSLRRVGAARLPQEVDAYRGEQKDKLDRWALALLDRLASSSDAAKAFERLKLESRNVTAFLVTCIQAENLARTFTQRITKAKVESARVESLDKAIVALCEFVDSQIAEQRDLPPFDPLSMQGASELLGWRADLTESAALKRGLHDLSGMKIVLSSIAESIVLSRRLAEGNMLRFGTNRKSQIKQAGQNAAMRWWADGMRRITGKPHAREINDLAAVVLGIRKLSPDRVAHAIRQRHYQKSARSRPKKGRNTPRKKTLPK